VNPAAAERIKAFVMEAAAFLAEQPDVWPTPAIAIIAKPSREAVARNYDRSLIRIMPRLSKTTQSEQQRRVFKVRSLSISSRGCSLMSCVIAFRNEAHRLIALSRKS
jgi:hypothetical protein